MPSVNRSLSLLRVFAFGIVSLFSLIVLAMSADILQLFHVRLDFAGLGVATSVLTLVTLPAMLFISRLYSGVLPSFVAVELSWTAFLWIMWLATAGTTASINFTGGNCDKLFLGRALTICGEVNAIEAFSFLSWFTLMGYFITLLGFSIRAAQLGNTRIWTTSVDKGDFGSGSSNTQDKKTVTEQPPI